MKPALSEKQHSLLQISDLKAPYVSFVVACYNTGDYMKTCLNSLVFQSLQEIEIVVVNDGSTDHSQEIIDYYQKLWPDKIKSYIKENGGLTDARRFGFSKVTAPYVYFVDSDDWVSKDCAEKMLQTALKDDCDIVYSPHYEVDAETNYIRLVSTLKPINSPAPLSMKDYIGRGDVAFWSKLYKTDFFRQQGRFLDMWHEDVGATPVTMSYAKKIGYYDRGTYFYLRGRRDSITTVSNDKRRTDIFAGEDMALQDIKPAHREYLYTKMAVRSVWNQRFDNIYDKVVQRAKENADHYMREEVLNTMTKKEQDSLTDILNLGDPIIPEIAYINGFRRDIDLDAYKSMVQELAFFDGVQIIVLDERSCNIHENEAICAAYENGDATCAVQYFAMKKIYETGGVFIDYGVSLITTLNRIRFNSAFFSYFSEKSISPFIFGGAKGNKIMGIILKTYSSSFYKDPKTPLADRIRDAMVGSCGFNVDGTECHNQSLNVTLYSPRTFVVPVSFSPALAFHDFTKLPAAERTETVTVPKEILDYLDYDLAVTRKALLQRQNELTTQYRAVKVLNDKRRALQKRIGAMRSSVSWKLTRPVRGIRIVLKKILSKLK